VSWWKSVNLSWPMNTWRALALCLASGILQKMKVHSVICDRYEVVVVPFPFAEIPVVKKRPVFVFSARNFNEENGHTLVGMITTAKKTSWPSDVKITNLQVAGLQVDCIARWRLVTVSNSLILRKLGNIDPVDQLNFERIRAAILI
jgi:mRNA interferase MazF